MGIRMQEYSPEAHPQWPEGLPVSHTSYGSTTCHQCQDWDQSFKLGLWQHFLSEIYTQDSHTEEKIAKAKLSQVTEFYGCFST